MVMVKVSGVRSVDEARRVDGLADYVAVYLGGPEGLNPSVAREIAGALSKSTPVAIVRGVPLPEAVKLAVENGFRVLEYRHLMPSVSVATLAEIAERHGVRIAPLLPVSVEGAEPACSFYRSLTGLTSNIEYLVAYGSVPGLPDCASRSRVAAGLGGDVCSLVDEGFQVIDVDYRELGEDGVRMIVEVLQKCKNG